jgi:hypothetical protein
VPHVFVCPAHEVADEEFLEALKVNLRLQAARALSVPHRQLSTGDFGFKFFESHKLDEPLSDIDIIIFADSKDHPERLEDPDGLAEKIGGAVSETIEAFCTSQASPVEFTVTVALSAIGYYRGSAEAQPSNISYR